jgi:hypothetical protein
MQFLSVFAVPAALIFATAAAADDVSQPSNPAPAQTAPPATVQLTVAMPSVPGTDANKIICHQVEYDGMLVRRPQCHTAHEWESRQATRQRELQQLQIRASSHGG